jgi:hypothetical protein
MMACSFCALQATYVSVYDRHLSSLRQAFFCKRIPGEVQTQLVPQHRGA